MGFENVYTFSIYNNPIMANSPNPTKKKRLFDRWDISLDELSHIIESRSKGDERIGMILGVFVWCFLRAVRKEPYSQYVG